MKARSINSCVTEFLSFSNREQQIRNKITTIKEGEEKNAKRRKVVKIRKWRRAERRRRRERKEKERNRNGT
jgi:hypothetical protein